MDKKDIEKKIQETVLLMAKEPKNTDYYHDLAKYYAMEGSFDKVTSVYESLIEIDPKDIQALLNLGNIHFYSKDFKKALKYYNQAMIIQPGNYQVYYNLGNT